MKCVCCVGACPAIGQSGTTNVCRKGAAHRSHDHCCGKYELFISNWEVGRVEFGFFFFKEMVETCTHVFVGYMYVCLSYP